jgi:membrane protein DedA with SNARE-associated domain
MNYLWWKMIDQILHITSELVSQFGYLGIFFLMFFENLGFPLPTEIGFIFGQTLVTSGQAGYFDIFIIILVGKTVGSILSYFTGRFFADRIKMIKNSSRLKKAQVIFSNWTEKYGSFAVFISRLVGYIRPWSSYLAGIGEIKFLPFIIYNILGSMVIIVLSMLVLGGAVEIWNNMPGLRVLAVPLFLIFFFGFWIGLWIYQKVKGTKTK